MNSLSNHDSNWTNTADAAKHLSDNLKRFYPNLNDPDHDNILIFQTDGQMGHQGITSAQLNVLKTNTFFLFLKSSNPDL